MMISTIPAPGKTAVPNENATSETGKNPPVMTIRQTQLNMIENQIRAIGVKSPDLLNTFTSVRRENFVPDAYREIAYADTEIPLIYNESMLTPRTEAMVLHAACIKETDQVLEIGSGSGFMAALLAYRARHVTTVEIKPQIKKLAEKNLAENNIHNVTVELGNGANGWETGASYDVIVISGALLRLSDAFRNILNPGGRIVAFIGHAPFTQTQLIRKINDAHYETISLFGTSVKLLREQTKIFCSRF